VKRVLLIGAGHGHLVVLRSLADRPLYGARITLVTPSPKVVYSGMLPGLLAGHYRRADAQIDVAALAERAYVEFEQGEVIRLDAANRLALLRDGRSFGYDGLRATLVRRAELAGIKGFHPHVLRHTAAHRWLAAGGSEGGLMATAGWANRAMLDRYAAATRAERAAAEARGLNLGDV